MDVLNNLVDNIYSSWQQFISGESVVEVAKQRIVAYLDEWKEYLVGNKTSIVAIFPEDKPFIHVNQLYSFSSKGLCFPYNLNITLTPVPSHSNNKSVLLVNPNILLDDGDDTSHDILIDLMERTSRRYAIRRVLNISSHSHNDIHPITWPERLENLSIRQRSSITFTSNALSTVTSCDSSGIIPLNPTYDIILASGDSIDIFFGEEAIYYFTSRYHGRNVCFRVVVI